MGQSESKEVEPQRVHGKLRDKAHEKAADAPPTGVSSGKLQQRASRPDLKSKRSPNPASLAPVASVSTSTTHAHAHSTVVATRPRSITAPGARQSLLTGPSSPNTKPETSMGQSHGTATHDRTPSRASTLPAPSASQELEDTEPPLPAEPVDIPPRDREADSLGRQDIDQLATHFSPSDYALPPINLTRPPRLPLPIEEELHTPGSPIITPQDLGPPLESIDVDSGIPRRSSVLSSTTVDDDEVGDDEYLPDITPSAPTVPTKLEWKGSGDKIFVTGTFVNWGRKYKLDKNKNGPGFSTTLNLRPGTHHIKFLVNNDMVTSDDLPTTVDYTNILVNYIEVAAPNLQSPTQPPAPAEPMPIPGATAVDVDKITMERDRAETSKRGTGSDLIQSPSDDLERKKSIAGSQSAETSAEQQNLAKEVKYLPRATYTNQLPDFLHELDVYTNPDDERYKRANRVTQTLPHPPSLPMFMSKSILNGQTPHKDDASVLIMPNHTVLNHLATSSIKHKILATSGTTRYKRKFLTTIMYKPTSDSG